MLCLSLQSSRRLWCYVKKLREMKMDFRSRGVILHVYSPTSCKSYPIREKHSLHIWLFSSPEPVDLFFFSLFRITVLHASLVWDVLRFFFYFCCKTFDAIITITLSMSTANEPSLLDRILCSRQICRHDSQQICAPASGYTADTSTVWADNVVAVGVISSYAQEPGYYTSLTYRHAERRDWVLRVALEIPFRIREVLVRYVGPNTITVFGGFRSFYQYLR